MRSVLPMFLVGVVSAATAPALASPVQGNVTRMRSSDAGVAKPLGYWRIANGVVPIRNATEAEPLLAVATGAGSKTTGCEARYVGGALEPTVMAAAPGGELQLSNSDSFSHRPVASSLPEVNGEVLAAGGTLTISVPSGGPWTITDRSYAHIQGVLHAIPDLRACAVVDGDGNFSFGELPAGDYKLLILREDGVAATRSFTSTGQEAVQLGAVSLTRAGR